MAVAQPRLGFHERTTDVWELKKKIEMVELWEETHIGLWHQDSNGKSAIFSRKHIVESAMIQVSICL